MEEEGKQSRKSSASSKSSKSSADGKWQQSYVFEDADDDGINDKTPGDIPAKYLNVSSARC